MHEQGFNYGLKLARGPHSLAPSLAVLPSMSLIPSRSIVLICGDQEPFNRLAGEESLHNLRDVLDRDAPIKEVIWFDQNRHAGVALIETARCADARLELCKSARGKLLFQDSIHFFRVFSRAGSFRVVLGPTIDADKEIALALQKGESRIRRTGRQRPKNSQLCSGNNGRYLASRLRFPETRQGPTSVRNLPPSA